MLGQLRLEMSSSKITGSSIEIQDLLGKLHSRSLYDRTTALTSLLQVTQDSTGAFFSLDVASQPKMPFRLFSAF